MFFIILAFPVLEIWLLFRVGEIIGLANTFFYLLACAVFGIGLLRTQGFYLMRTMQTNLAQGKTPGGPILHSLAIFLAGALFIVPGYLSTAAAVLLLLPGTRHIAVHLMRRKFASMVKQGGVHFSAGFGGPGGFSQWTNQWTNGAQPPMRDVSPLEIDSHSNREVIDVTPTKKD